MSSATAADASAADRLADEPGFEQWLSYLLVAAGWLLASTIATAIARVVRRQ